MACNCLDRFVKDLKKRCDGKCYLVEPNYCPICGTRYSDRDDADSYDIRDFFLNVAYLNIGHIYTYAKKDGLCSVSLIKWGSKAVITRIMIPGYLPDEQRKLIKEKALRCMENELVDHDYVKAIFVLFTNSMYKGVLDNCGYTKTDTSSLTRGVMWLKKEIANGKKELYVKYFK